ncbi:MAG: GTP diphosphokinase [Xanthomonadaceae bacterium]|nr:GTP diphosphokinase [Xanthomonadaceae bacterium]
MVSVNAELSELIQQDRLDCDEWLSRLPVAYNPSDQDMLRTAWRVARDGYGDRRRPSGDRYFAHALSVASILADLKLDANTIAAALQHDLLRLGLYDAETCRQTFGNNVADLLEGLARMEVIRDLHERPGTAEQQAEALRKMILAMARDIRVVFITLAERLDDMRQLRNLPPEEQRRIARETQDLYAPLANRLGIWQLKWELEDLSFRYLQPETYKQIARLLAERRVDRENYIAKVKRQLSEALEKAGIRAEIDGRPKHLYSIWKKMQRKGLRFHELFDIRAVRVLVDDVASCYAALGVVHSLWRHIPKEFDDYIATPKKNNYRSLHTAVIGPEGRTLEVQIRTHEMHQQAELGVAAHWRYKEGGVHEQSFEQKIAWLRQVLEWGQEEAAAEDFVERFKAEIFEDRVYVISPKGDIIDLPKGATPLDFAYYIHSDIGHRCRGAKVNGRIVPLTYELQNGEQVEILTSKEGGPSRDWLNPSLGYLRTSRARAKARSWFRQQDLEKNIAAGRTILERQLHRLGVTDANLERLAQKSRYGKLDDFLAAIGRNDITGAQIATLVADQLLPAKEESAEEILHATPVPARSEGKGDVSIYGVGDLLTRLAQCCKPAPGDQIVGYITRGQGVSIHRSDCPNLHRLAEEEGERIIEVSWNLGGDKRYPVDIQIEALDRQGLLRDISAVLSNEKINVVGVVTRTDPSNHRAHMTISILVDDIGQLTRAMDRIAVVRNVIDVHRRTSG